MTKIFHRFRSTHALLDGYNELENQEIYFATPEELNDPMEGFKDIFWRGDNIVWVNLLKHYLLCLEHVCYLFALFGESRHIDSKDISVFMTHDDLPTLQYKELYTEVCNRFFSNSLVSQYAKNLAKKSRPLRRDELLSIITGLHLYAINTIYTIYENHGFVAKRATSDDFQQMVEKPLLDQQAFDLIDKAEKEHSDAEALIETMYSVMKHTMAQIELINRYNGGMPYDEPNKIFIYSKFPEAYIQAIEKMIYPDWYAACFMSECTNSSVWGHYGDKHQGVCLSFKAVCGNNHEYINLSGLKSWGSSGPGKGKRKHAFHRIDYDKKYVEIDFFRSLGRLSLPVLTKFWYSDESGLKSVCADGIFDSEDQWREKYWANFTKGATTKLKDWEYEVEYRLILSSSLLDLHDPASRKLKYDFSDLHAITFGIKTPMEDKLRIIKIIESKCRNENRGDFKFYQAHYSKEKGSIDRAEMGMIKFESEQK